MTIAFLTAVRPSPTPSAWAVGIVAILLFEGLSYCVRYIRRVRHMEAVKRNTRAMRYDGRRWADERLNWPIYEEVS